MNNDCKIFGDSLAYISNWIHRQPNVKEESLTDWLLFELSIKIPRIRYVAFTRHEEARKTGADWEWWFLCPHEQNFRFRIQAKKLKHNGDQYPSLAHTNQYGLQIDKLIDDAKATNAIPAYAFYSATTGGGACPRAARSSGAFSMGAQAVYDQFIAPGKKPVSESDVLTYSLPLDCFICCQQTSMGGMQPFVDMYFTTERDALRGANDNVQPGQYASIPNHIKDLLKQPDAVPDWWQQEFRNDVQGLNALLIYDARG